MRAVRGIALIALAVAGCEKRGLSSVDAELARRNAGDYYIVAADHDRAVISALGRKVAIEPAEGFCLATSSLEVTDRSAFALIGDCTLEAPGVRGSEDERGELTLPRGVPGIITVSISGNPGLTASESRDAALTALSDYLTTSEGRAMLGRGRTSGPVDLLDRRRIGDGIYVFVEESDDDVLPILDQRFWRAFLEINGRMVVVTVSGFRDSPLEKDEMLRYLVSQVKTMDHANSRPIREDGVFIASNDAGGRFVAPLADAAIEAAAADLDGTGESETTLHDIGDAPELWPVPRRRPARPSARSVRAENVPLPPTRTAGDAPAPPASGRAIADPAEGPETAPADTALPATPFAPREAPVAPARPRRA